MEISLDHINNIWQTLVQYHDFVETCFNFFPSLSVLFLLTISIYGVIIVRQTIVRIVLVCYKLCLYVFYRLFCRLSRSDYMFPTTRQVLHRLQQHQHVATCFACGFKQWVSNINPNHFKFQNFRSAPTSLHSVLQTTLWEQTPYGWNDITSQYISYTTSILPQQQQQPPTTTTTIFTAKSSPLTYGDVALLWPTTTSSSTYISSQNDTVYDNTNEYTYQPHFEQQLIRQALHDLHTISPIESSIQSNYQYIQDDSVDNSDLEHVPFICCHADCGASNGSAFLTVTRQELFAAAATSQIQKNTTKTTSNSSLNCLLTTLSPAYQTTVHSKADIIQQTTQQPSYFPLQTTEEHQQQQQQQQQHHHHHRALNTQDKTLHVSNTNAPAPPIAPVLCPACIEVQQSAIALERNKQSSWYLDQSRRIFETCSTQLTDMFGFIRQDGNDSVEIEHNTIQQRQPTQHTPKRKHRRRMALDDEDNDENNNNNNDNDDTAILTKSSSTTTATTTTTTPASSSRLAQLKALIPPLSVTKQRFSQQQQQQNQSRDISNNSQEGPSVSTLETLLHLLPLSIFDPDCHKTPQERTLGDIPPQSTNIPLCSQCQHQLTIHNQAMVRWLAHTKQYYNTTQRHIPTTTQHSYLSPLNSNTSSSDVSPSVTNSNILQFSPHTTPDSTPSTIIPTHFTFKLGLFHNILVAWQTPPGFIKCLMFPLLCITYLAIIMMYILSFIFSSLLSFGLLFCCYPFVQIGQHLFLCCIDIISLWCIHPRILISQPFLSRLHYPQYKSIPDLVSHLISTYWTTSHHNHISQSLHFNNSCIIPSNQINSPTSLIEQQHIFSSNIASNESLLSNSSTTITNNIIHSFQNVLTFISKTISQQSQTAQHSSNSDQQPTPSTPSRAETLPLAKILLSAYFNQEQIYQTSIIPQFQTPPLTKSIGSTQDSSSSPIPLSPADRLPDVVPHQQLSQPLTHSLTIPHLSPRAIVTVLGSYLSPIGSLSSLPMRFFSRSPFVMLVQYALAFLLYFLLGMALRTTVLSHLQLFLSPWFDLESFLDGPVRFATAHNERSLGKEALSFILHKISFALFSTILHFLIGLCITIIILFVILMIVLQCIAHIHLCVKIASIIIYFPILVICCGFAQIFNICTHSTSLQSHTTNIDDDYVFQSPSQTIQTSTPTTLLNSPPYDQTEHPLMQFDLEQLEERILEPQHHNQLDHIATIDESHCDHHRRPSSPKRKKHHNASYVDSGYVPAQLHEEKEGTDMISPPMNTLHDNIHPGSHRDNNNNNNNDTTIIDNSLHHGVAHLSLGFGDEGKNHSPRNAASAAAAAAVATTGAVTTATASFYESKPSYADSDLSTFTQTKLQPAFSRQGVIFPDDIDDVTTSHTFQKPKQLLQSALPSPPLSVSSLASQPPPPQVSAEAASGATTPKTLHWIARWWLNLSWQEVFIFVGFFPFLLVRSLVVYSWLYFRKGGLYVITGSFDEIATSSDQFSPQQQQPPQPPPPPQQQQQQQQQSSTNLSQNDRWTSNNNHHNQQQLLSPLSLSPFPSSLSPVHSSYTHRISTPHAEQSHIFSESNAAVDHHHNPHRIENSYHNQAHTSFPSQIATSPVALATMTTQPTTIASPQFFSDLLVPLQHLSVTPSNIQSHTNHYGKNKAENMREKQPFSLHHYGQHNPYPLQQHTFHQQPQPSSPQPEILSANHSFSISSSHLASPHASLLLNNSQLLHNSQLIQPPAVPPTGCTTGPNSAHPSRHHPNLHLGSNFDDTVMGDGI